jgi:WD40 repeat protein
VVTGCDSSSIAVWDIETGSKSIVFSNAHGDEEITCMVFDEVERRLITGARNGTIKVAYADCTFNPFSDFCIE